MPDHPVAFLSYARKDDTYAKGRITTFRERLIAAYEAITGERLAVFQDIETAWGKDWQAELNQGLAGAHFLIPFISPLYFTRPACLEELDTFSRQEARSGRRDLILPVYWIHCDLFDNPPKPPAGEAERLAAVVKAHQYRDWRDLRFKDFDAPDMAREFEALSQEIAVAVRERTRRPGAPSAAAQASPDMRELLAALDGFVERAEALYRDASLNSFNEQKITNAQSIRDMVTKWVEMPRTRETVGLLVTARECLQFFIAEAEDWGFLNRFDVVPFDRFLTVMEQGIKQFPARLPDKPHEPVPLDWDRIESPGDQALRALNREAGRIRKDDVPNAGRFLPPFEVARLEAELAAIEGITSASRFRPMALSEKRAVIEDFKKKLNACVLLLQMQDLALGHYVDLLEPPAVFRDHPDAPEMVPLRKGQFRMGSEEYDDEKPPHEVTIGYRFAVGRYPVTFAEYDRFVAATGARAPDDRGWGRERRPVINGSWDDAQAYAAWLSQETGKPYRLLTEAEWEYACRAGTTTRYSWSDDITPEKANYAASEHGKTTPVGSYPANTWGLYDMHGNVWEWVEDKWHESYEGAPDDGSARTTGHGSSRVLRGGSWHYDPEDLRSAHRNGFTPDNRNSDAGFRVARTLTP